jgi:2-dehydro-3-deoxy-D-arabinonate dehydratase
MSARLLADAPEIAVDTVGSQACVPAPVDEVWAAGVTYKMSEQARENESDDPDIYRDVYRSDRPEIFFKATPNRIVGPHSDIGIRGDSNWNVPEPELGIVLYDGAIAGYTIGNDVSSRAIEGANPLYLPQAKVYERCCSLGPCIVSPETVTDPTALDMSMTIERDGAVMYEGQTCIGEMVRSIDELVSYYDRHNAVPELAVLLTGTPLVPDDEFSLREGDDVSISIESIGVLENSVSVV